MVCFQTSAVFFAELFPCIRIFATAFPISPHRLNGVAMVFPVLRVALFIPSLNFPMVTLLHNKHNYYNYFLFFVKFALWLN